MARIRTIKPEFPQSESLGRVSRDARLLFILLWPICDDHGRTRAASRMLASILFPYDDDAPKLVPRWLDELEQERCIIRYEIEGSQYLEVCKWLIHQKIDKPGKPQFPPPREDSANIREDSRTVVVGREGKGREKNRSSLAQQVGRTSVRFAEFWSAYPSRPGTSKGKRKDCLAKWGSKRLDETADTILADIATRLRLDKQWRDGYMPDPLSYLNQERWTDGFSAAATLPAVSADTPKKNIYANPESPLEQAEAWARQARASGVLPEADIAAHLDRVRAKVAHPGATP